MKFIETAEDGAIDISEYVSTDGLQVEFDPEHETELERLRTNYQHSIEFTADDLRKLAKAMNAQVYGHPDPQRAMNANIEYPTSTPSWSRRRK